MIASRTINTGDITHLVIIDLDINGHQEHHTAFLTKLGNYLLVLGLPLLQHHNPLIDREWDTIDIVSPRYTTTYTPRPTKVTTMHILPPRPRTIDIAALSLAAFRKTYRTERHLHETAMTSAISSDDNDAMLETPDQDQAPEFPEEYQEFTTLFSKKVANQLPPHRSEDHRIQLREGTTPSFGPLYSLSRLELKALRIWLDVNMAKGCIRQSSSPAGSPILFAKKKDCSFRCCVDYRDLNEKTNKNRYYLSLKQETLK